MRRHWTLPRSCPSRPLHCDVHAQCQPFFTRTATTWSWRPPPPCRLTRATSQASARSLNESSRSDLRDSRRGDDLEPLDTLMEEKSSNRSAGSDGAPPAPVDPPPPRTRLVTPAESLAGNDDVDHQALKAFLERKLGATAPAVALAARKNSTKTSRVLLMAAVAWPCGGNGSVCAHMPMTRV